MEKEENIPISQSGNCSIGCSSADLKETDDSTNNNQQSEVTSNKINGSTTTEPLCDSDVACNDWEIYETWTILGEPVLKPIILEPKHTLPRPNESQPKVDEIKTPVTANLVNSFETDDKYVIDSDEGIVQKVTNNLTEKNTLVIPTDMGTRRDCDTSSDISVISDCSDCANHRSWPLTIDTCNLFADVSNYDTPPNTPDTDIPAPTFKITPNLSPRESTEKFSVESRSSRTFDSVSPVNIILFSLLAGITGIVLGNAFRVRPEEDGSILNHISPMVLRIQDLERENSDLKSQLKKFKSVNSDTGSSSTGPEMVFPQPLEFYLEQNIIENGKRVWTGDPDNEEPITLENSKLKMPEFCTEDVADDLFADHYQKICDKKEQKLSKIVKGSQQEPCGTVSSTCSGCQSSRCSSSTTKQSDVEANFADDDESSVDRVQLEKDKSPQLKRKLKRQRPVKDDDSDSSDTVTNDSDKPANGCKKSACAGIFDKRKKDKKNWKEDKENKKIKKTGDDWYEKRKLGRDEMRRSNAAADSGNDDWFTKRASNREKQRGNGIDKKK